MKICLLIFLPVLLLCSCAGSQQKPVTQQPQDTTTAAQPSFAREPYIDTTVGNRHFGVSFYGDSAVVQTDSIQRGLKLVCSHDKNKGIRIYDQGYHMGNFAAMGPVFVAAFFDNGSSRQMDMMIVQQQPPYAFLSTDSSGKLAWVPEPSTFHTEGAIVQLSKQAVLVFYDIDSVLVDRHGVQQQEKWFGCKKLEPSDVGKFPKEYSIKGTGNEYADSTDTEQLFLKLSKL